MNIQEYISSGIVESYVLGLADAAESLEFERLCLQYPELVAARQAFEEALEKHALENAVVPSAQVKQHLLEVIGGETTGKSSSKVIQMEPVNTTTSARKGGMSRIIAAAAVILLIVAAYLYYEADKTSKENIAAKEAAQEELRIKDSILQKILDETKKSVQNPNAIVVNMEGTKIAPQSSASIYWDSTTSDVYLVVKNMPQLANDKQYQLWALINGQPKDLGVFDGKKDENMILRMKNTEKAQAFAITIEKKGGNPTPTLDSMQSMGEMKAKQ